MSSGGGGLHFTSGGQSSLTWVMHRPGLTSRIATTSSGGHSILIGAGGLHGGTGLDHVAFVLALLIAVVIVGVGGGWQRRALVPSLRRTAVLVSAFTLAHSLTLIAAALGWVSLPAQLVECAIAASIVWTAAASAIRPGARGGWAVALPVTWALARAIGAPAYRRYALPAFAAVLGALGLVWLVERLCAVTLLGL